MKRIIATLATVVIFATSSMNVKLNDEEFRIVKHVHVVKAMTNNTIFEETIVKQQEIERKKAEQEKAKRSERKHKADFELISLVVMAEAEGEPEEGKRLVIDSILNRVDSDIFPNTVREVIYQPYQFTSMTNGRVDRCYVKKDIYNLVVEEYKNRYNSEVIFFRTNHYSEYGNPMFKVCCHYFSSL